MLINMGYNVYIFVKLQYNHCVKSVQLYRGASEGNYVDGKVVASLKGEVGYGVQVKSATSC